MSKKKISKSISYKDWDYIGKYNYAAKWLRPLCNYTLMQELDGRFKREQKICLPLYLILFIPVHILQALWCLWDGGLKDFEISERYLGGDWIVQGSEVFKRAEEIWNRK